MNQSSDRAPWATVYESRPWAIQQHPFMSRRAMLRAQGNYQAAIPPQIASADMNLPASVLALVDEATQEMVQFDTEISVLAPELAQLVLLAEAAASSRIEGITASPMKIALAGLGAPTISDALLVTANMRAITTANENLDSYSTETILRIQQTLLEESNPDIT